MARFGCSKEVSRRVSLVSRVFEGSYRDFNDQKVVSRFGMQLFTV